jgi:hypothetical protein
VYWIWGVGGLVVSLSMLSLPIAGLGPILIWIGGMVLLGFGEMINQNQSKREAIWREQFAARREQGRQTAQP